MLSFPLSLSLSLCRIARIHREPTKLFDYGGVLGFSEGSAPVAGRERWFAESELNVADTCFLNRSVGAPEEQVAIVWAREGHAWNQGENADREALRSKHLRTWTYVAFSTLSLPYFL